MFGLKGLLGLSALRGADLAILNCLMGGPSDAHGELLSYLLFDRDFVDLLIEAGRDDALSTLDALGDDPWRLSRETAPVGTGS